MDTKQKQLNEIEKLRILAPKNRVYSEEEAVKITENHRIIDSVLKILS